MKKKFRYLPVIACLGYYIAVCITTGRVGGTQLIWLVLAAFFGLMGWLRKRCAQAEKDGRSHGRTLRRERLALRICTGLLIAGLGCAAVAEGAILSAMVREPAANADYVIVLGAKVNGTTPSLSLRYRIDSAADYLKENPDSKVIASGGQGNDEAISEGLAIARSLEAKGIDPARILIENKSTSTEENLQFSMALLESDGGSANSSVVIVTSDFHMFRALRLAERAGYTNASGKTAPSMGGLTPQNHLREILAIGFYFVTGAL